MPIFRDDEVLLTATWTPRNGTAVNGSQLPDRFTAALDRVGHDLLSRQFNGSIARVEFEARYAGYLEAVYLASNVTPQGGVAAGFGVSGGGAMLDSSEDQITVSFADLTQDQIARSGIAWPRGRTGGFLNPVLDAGSAVWTGRDGEQTTIGDLQ